MARVNRSLVDSIMEEIRRTVGESNESGAVSDELLLDLLNTAQDTAAQVLARHYADPLLAKVDITLTPNLDIPIPEDAYEQRILKLEYISSTATAPNPLTRVDFESDVVAYYAPGTSNSTPEFYYEVGSERVIKLLPAPSGGGTIRMWYAKAPTPLVPSLCRVKSVVNTSTVEVNELPDDITSNLDDDGSHLSLIDGQTGAIKAILEVSAVSTTTDTIQFSLTPLQAKVEGVAVEACPDLTAEDCVGDYLCLAPYTAIPQLRQPVLNYVKAYAIALVQNNLGANHEVAYQALKNMEEFVRSMNKNKPNTKQVKMRSDALGGNLKKLNWPRPQQ